MAVNTYKEDEKVSDVSNIKTLLRTVSYLKDYKVQTFFAILMILAQTLIVAILPSFSERAVDVNIANKDVRGLLINEFLETLEGDYENVFFRDEP